MEEILNFTRVCLFWYIYEADNASFDGMSCMWNAGHIISMILKRRVADPGRKKRAQIVMISETV